MRGSRAENFFTEEERARITGTIREAESRTRGEIAVAVAGESSHYLIAEWLPALLAALALAAVPWHLWDVPVWQRMAAAALVIASARLLTELAPGLKRAFILSRWMEGVVRRRAEAVFVERGLDRTREHTGVLFYLSLFEQWVVVLADSGIHKWITRDELERYAGMVSGGVRENRAAEALCAAIEEAGRHLAEHFPIAAGDVNELGDEVITE